MKDRTEILKEINVALKSRKLYPAGHPAAASAVKKSFQLLGKGLQGKNTLAIGFVNEALVFEERPVENFENLYPDFARHLSEKKISSIIFERGLTEKELSAVTDILTDDVVYQDDELQEKLRSEGVAHVTFKTSIDGKALETYRGAVEVVKNVMAEVRMGKIPRAGQVNTIVDDITDSIFSDQNAMVGLTMIKDYDNYLYNHSVNVSVLALSLGKSMGLEQNELHAVGVAALLHDVGKTGVSEDIIRKPGGLSSDEWEKVKEHPVLGSDITKRMDGMEDLIGRLIYEHHIKYDHSGYPETTSTLHPYSQILTICDAYDALTTLRVYQQPHNPAEAIKVMNNFSGRHFNPETLKSFINMIGVYPVGTMVRLTTNEVCMVTRVDAETPDSPTVKVLFDKDGNAQDEPFDVDLSSEVERDRRITALVNPATTDINIEAFFEKESSAA